MQATAKAIYELAPELEEGLPRWNVRGQKPVFQVSIKDGGDDLGDVPGRGTPWKIGWGVRPASVQVTVILKLKRKKEQEQI